jgi:hypothetical protein
MLDDRESITPNRYTRLKRAAAALLALQRTDFNEEEP